VHSPRGWALIALARAELFVCMSAAHERILQSEVAIAGESR